MSIEAKEEKKRIVSGIKASGNLHIGNYLGAVKNWVELHENYDAFFMIVDLHAITVDQDPKELRKNTLEIAKIFIASGINPDKATVFVQSDVKAHCELAWILNCTTAKMSDLKKMTQFKDKSSKGGVENASVGLFDYPVLQVADILLYDTELVPVGEDQVQHIELSRTLARRFNSKFGDTFLIPQHSITKEGKRIMGLDDATKKMSKSAGSKYNYIALIDDEETIRKKVMKAVTDSQEGITYSDDRPALKNLINIYKLLSNKSISEIEQKYKGKGFGDFKKDLGDIIVEFVIPLQKRVDSITDDEIQSILIEGAKKANVIAEKKLLEVRKKIGFLR